MVNERIRAMISVTMSRGRGGRWIEAQVLVESRWLMAST